MSWLWSLSSPAMLEVERSVGVCVEAVVLQDWELWQQQPELSAQLWQVCSYTTTTSYYPAHHGGMSPSRQSTTWSRDINKSSPARSTPITFLLPLPALSRGESWGQLNHTHHPTPSWPTLYVTHLQRICTHYHFHHTQPHIDRKTNNNECWHFLYTFTN